MLTAAAGAPGGISLTELIYVLAAVATIAGGWLGLRSAFNKYIKQRQAEAVEKSKLSDAITANAEATKENTVALGKMGQDFNDFATETRSQLLGHTERLQRLENLGRQQNHSI